MEEGREYFWQTFFWLECGKTGIGIAKLRVFDDEMVTDSTQSTVPLSELRKKELFDDSDGVMKYGNDTDIEKGENAPLAALLPEPKKELLPPLEQSPSQLEISGDDVGRQVPGEKKPLPSPAPIQKSKSTKKAEEEKKRKEEEDKLKVEEEKKRQEEENEKLTAERLKKLEEDEAIVENLRKELQEELVRRIQNVKIALLLLVLTLHSSGNLNLSTLYFHWHLLTFLTLNEGSEEERRSNRGRRRGI